MVVPAGDRERPLHLGAAAGVVALRGPDAERRGRGTLTRLAAVRALCVAVRAAGVVVRAGRRCCPTTQSGPLSSEAIAGTAGVDAVEHVAVASGRADVDVAGQRAGPLRRGVVALAVGEEREARSLVAAVADPVGVADDPDAGVGLVDRRRPPHRAGCGPGSTSAARRSAGRARPARAAARRPGRRGRSRCGLFIQRLWPPT